MASGLALHTPGAKDLAAVPVAPLTLGSLTIAHRQHMLAYPVHMRHSLETH